MPRGLQFFFNNQNDPNQEIIQNKKVTEYQSPARMNMSSIGPGLSGDADGVGNGSSLYVALDAQAPLQCSIEALVVLKTTLITVAGLSRVSDGVPDAGTFDRSLQVTAGAVPQFYIYDGGAKTTSASVTISVGVPVHLVGTSTGSLLSIYVNGQVSGTPTATNNGGYRGFTTPIWSQGYGSTSTLLNAQSPFIILHAAFANVGWTAAEVMQRYLDPYGFLTSAEGEWPALQVAPAAFQWYPMEPPDNNRPSKGYWVREMIRHD